MEIKRDVYLHKLINARQNGFIKVITGPRRCGKSYSLGDVPIDFLSFQSHLSLSGIEVGSVLIIVTDIFDVKILHIHFFAWFRSDNTLNRELGI